MKDAGIYIFVPHNVRRFYEAVGWEYVGMNDGYSSCYVWASKGKPIIPEVQEVRDEAVRQFDEIWPGGEQ